MIDWRLIPTEDVGMIWPTISKILLKAVERDEGKRSLHSLLRELVNDRNQLWIVFDGEPIGAVVTAILNYPHARTLKVEWLAGERFEEWAHLISEIESFAKAQGCNPVEFSGRPGLARVLKRYGYEVVAVEARKFHA